MAFAGCSARMCLGFVWFSALCRGLPGLGPRFGCFSLGFRHPCDAFEKAVRFN